jgi:hypothetical protein
MVGADRQRPPFRIGSTRVRGALWGLCSNGIQLRLVRDNASLTRPAYIEAVLGWIVGELAPRTASNASKYVFSIRIIVFRVSSL